MAINPETPEQCRRVDEGQGDWVSDVKSALSAASDLLVQGEKEAAIALAQKCLSAAKDMQEEGMEIGFSMEASTENLIRLANSPSSCLNCRWLSRWSYSGSFEEPPDAGWECGHPGVHQFLFMNKYGEFESEASMSPEEEEVAVAEFIAKDCDGYELFDWDKRDRLEYEAEKEYDKQAAETEKNLDQQIEEAIRGDSQPRLYELFNRETQEVETLKEMTEDCAASENEKYDCYGRPEIWRQASSPPTEPSSWCEAGLEKHFCPSQYGFYWNEDGTKFKVRRLRWAPDQAGYIAYQSME